MLSQGHYTETPVQDPQPQLTSPDNCPREVCEGFWAEQKRGNVTPVLGLWRVFWESIEIRALLPRELALHCPQRAGGMTSHTGRRPHTDLPQALTA